MLERNIALSILGTGNIFFLGALYLTIKEMKLSNMRSYFLFFLISITIYLNLMLILWSDTFNANIKLILAQSIFILAYATLFSYNLFVFKIISLPKTKFMKLAETILNILHVVGLTLSFIPDALVEKVNIENGYQTLTYGKYYGVFSLTFLLNLTFATILLIYGVRKSSDAFQKFQLKFLIFTTSLFLFLSFVTNGLITLIDPSKASSRLGIIWVPVALVAAFYILAYGRERFLKNEYSKLLKTVKRSRLLNDNFVALESCISVLKNIFEENSEEENSQKALNFKSKFGKKIFFLVPEVIMRSLQKKEDDEGPNDFELFQDKLLTSKEFMQSTLQENYFLRKENFRLSLSTEFLQKKIADSVHNSRSLEELKDFVDRKSFFSLDKVSHDLGINKNELKSYFNFWTKNVSELVTVVQRAIYGYREHMLSCNFNFTVDKKEPVGNGFSPLEIAEKEVIDSTLKENNFNKRKTARDLQITINTLVAKIKKYKL